MTNYPPATLRDPENPLTSIESGLVAQVAKLEGERDDLIALLRSEAAQLRRWAVQSRTGGWSTHQVEPMRQRANEIDDLLAKNAPPAVANKPASE